jgi:hypothetical protein
VFETSSGTIAYIPDCPVVPIGIEGRAAFKLTIKLKRPPDGRSKEVPTSLIEGGFCTLSLTLNLNLPPPYVSQFVRKADFSITHSGRCLATTSAAGAGASAFFSLTLEPEIVLDILIAISGHGSRTTVVTKLDLRWTGSPSDSLNFVSPLQGILENVPGESQLVSAVAPNWDRTGYEKIPRLVDNIRYRNGHAEAERLPVVANAHSLVPLRTTIVPKPAVAANAHVLLASAVAQPAGTSATHIHAAFLHDLSLVATPLPSGEHLPLVDNPGGTAFPDGVDKTSYWYSLTFRIVPPQVSDDV